MPSSGQLATALSVIGSLGTFNLNDHVNYAIAAENTRQAVTKSYKQITAESPTLSGEYVVHVTTGMVSEPVTLWCYGNTQTILNTNLKNLQSYFEQWTYQLQWTFADYTETWNCNAVTQLSWDLSQGLVHNYMAKVTLAVPRFSTVH